MNSHDQYPQLSANEQSVLSVFQALEVGDFDAALMFWADDCHDHAAIADAEPGKPGVRATMAFVHSAFPYARWRVTKLIANQHEVACGVVVEGIHQGDIYGVSATGQHVRWRHFHFFRFQDGRIVEHDAVRDDRGLLRQLEAEFPPKPASSA